MNGLSNILLGLSLLATVFIWRRMTARVRRNARQTDPKQTAQRAAQATTEVVNEQMQQMEMRLHNFSREVDGTAATRLAVLEQLIRDADDRIGQLDDMMQQCEQSLNSLKLKDQSTERSLTRQERQMVLHLLQAGYRAGEVAHLTGSSLAEVEKIEQQRTAA